MKEDKVRPLSSDERRLLERLFELPFVGRDELASQIEGLLVRWIDDNGSLELNVHGAEITRVSGGPAVEARYHESDSDETNLVSVNILLHTNGGKLSMLEIYKDDSSRPVNPIDPSKFILFSRGQNLPQGK